MKKLFAILILCVGASSLGYSQGLNFSRKFAVDTLWKFTNPEKIIVLNRMQFNQAIYSDTLNSLTTFLYIPDSVKITGYGFLNNLEAYSGDMVAIRDTARTTFPVGIGSATRPIDSTLTVFLPGSATEYGGIHARGLKLTGTLQQSLTFASGLSNAFTLPTSLTFTDPITSSGSTLGFNAVITADGASVDRRITGLRTAITYDATSGTNGSMIGAQLSLTHSGLGSTMSAMTGLQVSMVDGGVSTATNGYGIDITTMPTAGFTTLYGLKITNVTGGSTNYAIHTGSGNVQLGTLTASRLVASDASKNLVSTITAGNLLSSVTGTTGTAGNLMFSISPTTTGTFDAEAADFSSTLTLSGSAANIALGSNYLSGDGGDEGLSISSTGAATLSSTLSSGAITSSGDFTFSDDTKKLLWSDVNLYRSAANILMTDDNFQALQLIAPTLIRNATNTSLVMASGTSSTSGANILLNGSTVGVGNAYDIRFRTDATIIGEWDNSDGRWEFHDDFVIDNTLSVSGTIAPGGNTIQGALGVPAVNDTISWTGQTVTIAAQNFANTTTGKLFEVTFYVHTTTTGTGTVTFSLGWNDGAAKTFTSATAALTATDNTGMVYGTEVIYVASGTPTWATTVAGGGSTERYAVRVGLKRLW